ncbi:MULTISPECIES: hypothetical protein [Curtobacterium]|uniref:hypothetical protein n=1 Tax=Curtobacterium TaxID=2034 RepID=UPI000A861AC6|nr:MULTISPECIES: hypothetical protein [Curtobacterium]UBQ01931.1 hypothetical protein LCG91_12815 [Curtobacterium sp. TXMA1]
MSTDNVDLSKVAGMTASPRERHVFSKDEIDSIKARTPVPQGTPEERRARLHRALHSFVSRRDFSPASRLLDRG